MNSNDNSGVQATKMGRNQSLWREVNERIKAVAQTSSDVEFLCECAKLDCTDTLNLSMAEYEQIRSSPVQFPIAVGHEILEVERVVEETDRYIVVEKVGEAAEVVSKTDPRSS